jgi:hypothetical protein
MFWQKYLHLLKNGSSREHPSFPLPLPSLSVVIQEGPASP